MANAMDMERQKLIEAVERKRLLKAVEAKRAAQKKVYDPEADTDYYDSQYYDDVPESETSAPLELPMSETIDYPAMGRGALESLSFGTLPTVEGAGAFIGALTADEGYRPPIADNPEFQKEFGPAPEQGILGRYRRAKEAFGEGREEGIAESSEAFERSPVSFGSGVALGTIPSLALAAPKTLLGAAGMGAAYGTGEAIGHAESPKEAVFTIGSGAFLGAGGKVVGDIGSKVLKKIGSYSIDKLSKAKTYLNKKFPSVFPKISLYKLGEALTGVPEEAIREYTNKVDKINKMMKEVGDDWLGKANEIRNQTMKEIQNYKNTLSRKTTEALKDVDVKASKWEIVRDLEDSIVDWDKSLHAKDIEQVEDMVQMVINSGGGDRVDEISLKTLYEIKSILADNAKKAFLKDGQIFVQADKPRLAFRRAYYKAKRMLDLASDDLNKINNKYHQLHMLEERMFKNLLKEDKPYASLYSGGLGINPRFSKTLEKIGKLTGSKVKGKAKEAGAAQMFASPKYQPIQGTGKAAASLMQGMSLSVIGSKAVESLTGIGIDTSTAMALGALFTSPATLKAAINAGNIGRKTILKAMDVMKNPKVHKMMVRQGVESEGVEEELRNLYRYALIKTGITKKPKWEKPEDKRKPRKKIDMPPMDLIER